MRASISKKEKQKTEKIAWRGLGGRNPEETQWEQIPLELRAHKREEHKLD